MKRIRESKWLYALLSIFLATIFWLYVRSEVDPENSMPIHDVPVILSGVSFLESQNLAVTEQSDTTVDLTIHARASVLSQLNNKNITVTLDVSRCAEGTHPLTYSVTLPRNINTEGAIVERSSPEQITVTVERLAAKTLEIQCILRGSVAEGYQAGDFTVSPETITIRGSSEEIDRIAQAVVVLEAEDLSARFSGELPLRLMDAEGNELTNLDVKLDETAAYVTLPIYVVREIPLTVSFIPGGGATEENVSMPPLILPEFITVAGAEEDMAGLEEISLGSVNLSNVIGTGTTIFPINLDPSLQNVSGITSASVTVTITGLATRSFDVTNIEVINIPEGYRATPVTEMRTVAVRGIEEALEQIDASQLRIVADLSNVTAAGYTPVDVKVYLDANSSEVGIIGEYSIIVDVSR